MTDTEAAGLIRPLQTGSTGPQYWADLGCGNGVFSRALASLLPAESHILCMDKTTQKLPINNINGVQLEFKKADFVNYTFEGLQFHGLLMANSLHYVKEKEKLIYKLSGCLEPGGIFLVIEYDTLKSNPWVPYPIDLKGISVLFNGMGYRHITKLGERKSIYSARNMYACTITR